MENYDDLFLEIERIKNELITPNRNVRLTFLKTIIRGLALPIRARKLKLKHNIEIEGFDDYSLLPFFGNDGIKDHEKKLKELRKKLREMWQQWFRHQRFLPAHRHPCSLIFSRP